MDDSHPSNGGPQPPPDLPPALWDLASAARGRWLRKDALASQLADLLGREPANLRTKVLVRACPLQQHRRVRSLVRPFGGRAGFDEVKPSTIVRACSES